MFLKRDALIAPFTLQVLHNQGCKIQASCRKAALTMGIFAGGLEFDVSLAHPSAAYMMEHRVNDRALLPGAAMLDSCYSAATTLLAGSWPFSPSWPAHVWNPLIMTIPGRFSGNDRLDERSWIMGRALYSCIESSETAMLRRWRGPREDGAARRCHHCAAHTLQAAHCC